MPDRLHNIGQNNCSLHSCTLPIGPTSLIIRINIVNTLALFIILKTYVMDMHGNEKSVYIKTPKLWSPRSNLPALYKTHITDWIVLNWKWKLIFKSIAFHKSIATNSSEAHFATPHWWTLSTEQVYPRFFSQPLLSVFISKFDIK